MRKIKFKKKERGLFTGGPAPTNRPSQRSQPGLPAPRPPPSPMLGHGRVARAPDRVRPTAPRGWHARSPTPRPSPLPVDSASALAILASTPCALSRSLSRSLTSAPRAIVAARHWSFPSSLHLIPDASSPSSASFHLFELRLGFDVLGRALFAQVSLPRGPNHSPESARLRRSSPHCRCS